MCRRKPFVGVQKAAGKKIADESEGSDKRRQLLGTALLLAIFPGIDLLGENWKPESL